MENGGPAFPKEHSHNDRHHCVQSGMSLRDYFACHILEGKISPGTQVTQEMAEEAYRAATLMVKARQKDY